MRSYPASEFRPSKLTRKGNATRPHCLSLPESSLDGIDKGRIAASDDKEAGFTLRHRIHDAPSGKGYGRQPMRSGLDGNHAEAFRVAGDFPHWKYVYVRRAIYRSQFVIIGDHPQELDVAAHACGIGGGLDAGRRLRFGMQGLKGGIADDQQVRIGVRRNDTRQGARDKFPQTLACGKTPDGKQQRATPKTMPFAESPG